MQREKSFEWKSDIPEMTRPIKTMVKVESTEKEEPQQMTTEYFKVAFSQFKEANQEREALGMVFVIQKYQHYLLDNPFAFYTNH